MTADAIHDLERLTLYCMGLKLLHNEDLYNLELNSFFVTIKANFDSNYGNYSFYLFNSRDGIKHLQKQWMNEDTHLPP